MTENNLSQKLFTQKDGKRFAYAEDIQQIVMDLKKEFCICFSDQICENCKEIEKAFGKELSK